MFRGRQSTTPIGAAIENLGQMFLESQRSPVELERERVLGDFHRSSARKNTAEAVAAENANAARGGLADIFSSLPPGPMDIDAANRAAAAHAARGGLDPATAAQLNLLAASQTANEDQLGRQVVAMTGEGLDPNEGFTQPRLDEIVNRGHRFNTEITGMEQAGQTERTGIQADASRDVANIKGDFGLRRADLEQAGLDRRSREGLAAELYDNNLQRGFEHLQGRQGETAGGAPADAEPTFTDKVSPLDAERIVFQALDSMVSGAMVRDENGDLRVHPEFIAIVGADRYAAAVEAASQTMSQTRNPGAASQAFIEALGIEPGSTFSPSDPGSDPGFFNSVSLGAVGEPGSEPAPAAITPPGSAATTAGGAQGGPPPLESRVVGDSYPSPRGPMIWTGTGWIPAGGA